MSWVGGKLSERGEIALEFRQSFCSQAFPLLASPPHNDIQSLAALMTVEKQQVSPPHQLWQQLMAHLVGQFGFHCRVNFVGSHYRIYEFLPCVRHCDKYIKISGKNNFV